MEHLEEDPRPLASPVLEEDGTLKPANGPGILPGEPARMADDSRTGPDSNCLAATFGKVGEDDPSLQPLDHAAKLVRPELRQAPAGRCGQGPWTDRCENGSGPVFSFDTC